MTLEELQKAVNEFAANIARDPWINIRLREKAQRLAEATTEGEGTQPSPHNHHTQKEPTE